MPISVDLTHLISLVLLSAAVAVVFRKRKQLHLIRSLDMSLFLIRLPRYDIHEKDQKKEEKVMISRMEQLYSNFLYLDKNDNFLKRFFYGLPRVVFEIASEVGGGDISFYISVPSSYEDSLNKYVQGVYSGAIVEKVPEDYTVFEPGGEVAASYLKLRNSFYLPLNTYEDLGVDPLESIANSVTKISPDEGSGVQIVLRPASISLRKRGEDLLSRVIEKKKDLSDAVSYANAGLFLRFFKDLFESSQKKEDQGSPVKEKRVDDTVIEAIRSKIKKPGFEVNIRLIGVADRRERAREIVQNLEGSFSQFSSGVNGFNFVRMKSKRKIRSAVYDFSFRNFKKSQKNILNSEEIVSIFHLPLSHMESPYIKWVKTKEAPPPSELPGTGLLSIGEAVYRGEKRKVFVASKNDRRRHFYIIGQTGVGKSSLLREMIRQDIESGEGVGVIDPHGDLVEHTLESIPKERAEDVVLFEPFDRERPCGLNMLEWSLPEQRDFAISEMIMIFTSLFPPEVIGPMFEHYMRNAMAAVMADKDNPGTLVEIPRIFTDDRFMEEKLQKVTDPVIRNFWLREWRQTTGQTRSDMLGYVVSKIGRFVADEMMRNIIGQARSGFDLEKVMNEKKIFLANLSKGMTGELNSSLLGLILVSKMQIAALRRARIPEEERKDFYLYVDEFQNFTTDSVATILSEARKYRLNLILAHQYMPQLKEEIKNAVVGNVGTIASYRVGATDAEFLENQFEPEFSRFDLSNLDNFQYIIKMMVNNKVTSPFKVNAPVPASGSAEMAEVARKISKLKYGRPKFIVEEEIMERSRLGA